MAAKDFYCLFSILIAYFLFYLLTYLTTLLIAYLTASWNCLPILLFTAT